MLNTVYQKVVLLLVVVSYLANPLTWGAEKPGSRLTLLFTGDTAGKLKSDYHGWGGMAKRARVIGQIRRREKHVILVDIGDFLSPDYLPTKSEGRVVVDLLIQLKYDLVTLGNHDFDFGLEVLGHRIEELVVGDVMVVGTNLAAPDGRDYVYPSVLKTVELDSAKVNILFLGLLDPGSLTQPLPGQLQAKAPVPCLSRTLAQYQDAKIDLVVCLAHMRRSQVVGLAGELPAIDLFICLGEGPRSAEITALQITDTKTGRSTHLVNASRFGHHLGRVDVAFRGDRKELRVGAEPIDDAVPPDPVIGQQVFIEDNKANFPLFTLRPEENHPDTIVSLILRLVKDRTRAEVAILNRGMFNFQAMPFKDNQLTYNDLFEFIWVSDCLVRLKLAGRHIRELFKQSAERNPSPDGSSYLFGDGYDAKNGLINGKVMYDDDLYVVATNDFLAGGGDGYSLFVREGRDKRTRFAEKPRYLVPADPGRQLELRNDVIIPALVQRQSPGGLPLVDLKRRPLWKLDLHPLGVSVRQSWWNAGSRSYASLPSYPKNDLFQIDSKLYLVVARLGAVGTWKNEVDLKYGKQKYAGQDIYEDPDDARLTSRFEFLQLLKIPRSSHVVFPFLQVKYDTEFSPNPGQLRQMKLYNDLGLGFKHKGLQYIRLSVGSVQDLADTAATVGIGLGLNSLYIRRFVPKVVIEFSNKVEYLGNLTDPKNEHRLYIYNVFGIPLVKNLALHSEINWYNYWDSLVNKWATAIDYRVSLSYNFHTKVQRY